MLGALRGCGRRAVRGSEPLAGRGARQSSISGLWSLSQKAGFSGLSFFPEPAMPHQGDKKCKESVFTANQRGDPRKATMLGQSICCILIIC
ncbi:T0002084 isoform 3 [Pongo abelii]|uniref:T0002084 isoform 3 n=1 Tax=Pongo abelii TaxID=9601 RepID=A0A2J8XIT4_PONAB|nr:T0002084 isoform 3 [Pongo abelii]